MKPRFQLSLLLCLIALAVSAQKDTIAKLNVGAPAPPLRVKEWIKGTPVQNFEKGKVYVIEFWATWCAPCMASMPHLSKLARKYKRKVTFSAIDIYEGREGKTNSPAQIKAFVDRMGRRMDFNVAAEDTNYTVHDWLSAWGEMAYGIPRTFVVDNQGKVAWIGYPPDLDTVLRKILNNTWDIEEALAKRTFDGQWEKSDLEVIDKVRRYQGRYDHLEDLGNPDSTLLVIDEMVKKRADIKYAPWVASYTFSALLLTNPHQAYEYGKQAMVTATYGHPAWDKIIEDIRDGSRKINLPPEIYLLGAECYQADIDHIVYPQLVNRAKWYRNMAAWYTLAGEKQKAIKAERKAIRLYRKSK